ncbi:MAG: endonuclease Q family protein [Candidatus Hydrogenedentota bacterium]
MRYLADLHIHSPFSRATSKEMTIPNIYKWSCLKGIDVIATGDFTHPEWFSEIKKSLVENNNGLFELREDLKKNIRKEVFSSCSHLNPKFILSTEISCIYRKNNRIRKVHNVILMPDLKSAETFIKTLERIGNIRSDGRPILGLDSKELLKIVIETCPSSIFIPAHIWTPHFSVFGEFSGFGSIEECFDDLSRHIYAIETGLSSDPAMNWMVSSLDKFQLVSNSDAHSCENIGRECNIFESNTDISYNLIFDILKTGDGLVGTIEFFPEEGKYHYDGHRNCNIALHPFESIKNKLLCPVCKRKLTIGVLHRVIELADRKKVDQKQLNKKIYKSYIPLKEIISQFLGKTKTSKVVANQYFDLIKNLGPELKILDFDTSIKDSVIKYPVLEYVKNMHSYNIELNPGFDGKYGIIRVKNINAIKSEQMRLL